MKKLYFLAFLMGLALVALAIHNRPTQKTIEHIQAKIGNVTTVKVYPGMEVNIKRKR